MNVGVDNGKLLAYTLQVVEEGKMAEEMKNYQFRISAGLLSKLELMAKGEDRSVAYVIRRELAKYVHRMSGVTIAPGDEEIPPPADKSAEEKKS